MALIGKIREKSWLILILIGGALLAFILTDYQKITGGVEFKYGYGTVYGEMVDMQAFDEEVNIAQENANLQAKQQGQPTQPVDKSQVWTMFVENLILEKEYQALGIEVSEAEFDAYLYGKNGFNVLPDIQNQFKDSITGQFDEKALQTTIEQLETSDNPDDVQRWETSKEYYMERRRKEKYFDVLKQGVYVTKLEAKNEYQAQKEIKSIAFVVKRYNDVTDEETKPTEENLKAYFEKHKEEKKYANRTASREVKFFDVQIEPSKADSNSFASKMDELKKGFAQTTDDSTFVVQNSEWKFYSSKLTFRSDRDVSPQEKQSKPTYPAFMDTIFKSASVGDVVGPYEENGSMRIAKVIGFNENLLSVRHILIAAQRADEAAVAKAKKKVDSLMPLINAENFEKYVMMYSEDPGSKNTGGKYEDFLDYEMVPEFSDFAVNEPVGKIGYVQTDYGFHIMEVLDRKPTKLPMLAIVQKTLKPSTETINDMESEVDDLFYTLSDKLGAKDPGHTRVELFDTIVSKAGYFARSINIEENSPKVYGFESQVSEDKILELAFTEGAAEGDLISSPIKEGNRYVIALLASIREKGTPTYEQAAMAIKRDYIKEQKEKILKARMVNAKSLTDLQNRLDLQIQKSEVTFANPQITGAGFEPQVVGALFSGLKDGERTLPIAGNSGVFVVQVEKTTKAPAAANYEVERNGLESAVTSNISTNATKALTKLADVVDNRRFFEYNIRK